MKNNEIIYHAAIANGIYTQAEASAIINAGNVLPLHTYNTWRELGYQVKKGEKSVLTCSLWKMSNCTNDEGENLTKSYMTKSFLFKREQVEKIKTYKKRTPEELRAYNKMLAEQRNAKKAAAAKSEEIKPKNKKVKQPTIKKRQQILNRFLKLNFNEEFKTHYQQYNNKFAFISPYMMFVSNSSLDYTPISESATPFNIDAVIPKREGIKLSFDLENIKENIKAQKAEGRGTKKNPFLPYILKDNDFEIGFNPKYLLDFAELLSTNSIECFSPLKPACFKSENGEIGILCPVRL